MIWVYSFCSDQSFQILRVYANICMLFLLLNHSWEQLLQLHVTFSSTEPQTHGELYDQFMDYAQCILNKD